MKKRIYRPIAIQELSKEHLLEATESSQRVVVGCDAAKVSWRAALMTSSRELLSVVSFDVLETVTLLKLLVALRDAGRVIEVVAESTGTYADAFAYQVREAGLPMFQIGTKHVHDASEAYDGVPSNHDSKAACVIADQHLYRPERSQPWPCDEERRALEARCTSIAILQEDIQRDQGRAEGLLARHWPELLRELELKSACLASLLEAFGSPQAVAAAPEEARELLAKTSRNLLEAAKIDRIVRSASSTIGVPMCEDERELLRWLGKRLIVRRHEWRRAKAQVKQAMTQRPQTSSMQSVLGTVTTAILLAHIGDPTGFTSGRALLKHLGLNLKEDTSGTSKRRGLHITKRGSSRARKALYLAALRLMKRDPIARAWVGAKAVRQGDKTMKMKAIVALMRKLVTALPHLARGERFDASKLFDVERLKRRGALPADFVAPEVAAA
jgi:transposase